MVFPSTVSYIVKASESCVCGFGNCLTYTLDQRIHGLYWNFWISFSSSFLQQCPSLACPFPQNLFILITAHHQHHNHHHHQSSILFLFTSAITLNYKHSPKIINGNIMIARVVAGKIRERVKMTAHWSPDNSRSTTKKKKTSRWKLASDVKWYAVTALKFESFTGDGYKHH